MCVQRQRPLLVLVYRYRCQCILQVYDTCLLGFFQSLGNGFDLPVREVSEEMRQELDRQIVSKEELQAIYEEVKCAICQGVPEEVGVNRHCLHAMCK